MKIAFLVCNEVYAPRIKELFLKTEIDYYSCWEQVKGRGHGTQPHLGTRSFPGMNVVFMIAFEKEDPLTGLIQEIKHTNEEIQRPDDRIRLFQIPLEKII